MTEHAPQIADRVRSALTAEDPQLIAEVKALERLAFGRTVHVAANGRFPRWSVERWLAVATAFMAATISVVVWIFAAGGEWRATRMGVEELTRKMEALLQFQQRAEQRLWELQKQIEANERADADERSRRGRQTPAFPRDEQFTASGSGGS